MEVRWSRGNQINMPHCQLAIYHCRCHVDWNCRSRKPKVLQCTFMCLMPLFLSSLNWLLAALCSFFFGHVRVGLKTQLRTYGCISQFWWQIFFGRFAHTMQTCKGLFSFKRTLFSWRPSGRRPKVRKNASKVRKYPSSSDPSEPKRLFWKNVPFFHVRPSISQTFQQLAPQDQGEQMCSTPMYILQKSQNVHMFAPAAHWKKRQKVLYFDTNRGSKVVQPRSFSHAPGPEWCVRVPDPTSGRTSTKRSYNLA